MPKQETDAKSQYHYGQFTPSHLKAVAKGVVLFNERKFWECHEDLEDHWLEDVGDGARYVYWAIIQVAASLYHLREGNMEGARGMLSKAKKKFVECKKRRVTTDLMLNYLSWEEFEDLVMKISSTDAKVEDFDDLYEFRFKDPDIWGLEK